MSDDIDGLEDLARLYRQAEAPEPPVRLDRQIIKAAGRPRGRSPWAVPLSLAATLVLGVGLVTLVQEETQDGPSPARALAPQVLPESSPSPPPPAARQQLYDRAAIAPNATPAREEAAIRSLLMERQEAHPVTLEDVRRLLEQGQLEEARRALDDYRHWHPGETLPDDLRVLDDEIDAAESKADDP